jgi:hypothetical protein
MLELRILVIDIGSQPISYGVTTMAKSDKKFIGHTARFSYLSHFALERLNFGYAAARAVRGRETFLG